MNRLNESTDWIFDWIKYKYVVACFGWRFVNRGLLKRRGLEQGATRPQWARAGKLLWSDVRVPVLLWRASKSERSRVAFKCGCAGGRVSRSHKDRRVAGRPVCGRWGKMSRSRWAVEIERSFRVGGGTIGRAWMGKVVGGVRNACIGWHVRATKIKNRGRPCSKGVK